MRSFWYIFLVIGDITITADYNRYIPFTNCAPYFTCKTEINNFFKQNNSTKLGKECINSSISDYFSAFILVSWDIKVSAYNNTHIAFTIYALLSIFNTEINDLFKQNSSTKFETETIKWSLWDYFDVFILVTGYIKVTADNNADVAFTNCAPFSTCKAEINDLFKQNNSTKFETESIKSSLWD